MLGVAALVHVLLFSLFHIVSPRPQPRTISSATFYLLDSKSPKFSSLNQWLKAEDPALFAQTTAPNRLSWPTIQYVPSYDSERPSLAPLPKTNPEFPVPLGPIPFFLYSHSAGPRQASPIGVTGTRLEFGGGLANRRVRNLSADGLLASPSTPSLPCTFLVAVSPEGQLQHIFLLRSSGNSELDQLAMRNLQHTCMEPAPIKATAWGTATYLWGME